MLLVGADIRFDRSWLLYLFRAG